MYILLIQYVCVRVYKENSQMDHEYEQEYEHEHEHEYEEEPYYFEEPIEVNGDDYWDAYYNPEG